MNKNVLYHFLLLLLIGNSGFSQVNPEDWTTKFERSNYLETSDYAETMKYFQSLADYSPYAEMREFGISPQGRSLKYIILSKDQFTDPGEAKRSNKPIVMIENGIHSGEIEGKDASMLLLRDILITKELDRLLDNVIILVIPIFNVDGHERSSPFNRINQNGPASMGWRTTAQNLNLNRDFLKADAPEMRALLRLFSDWLPDFFIDTHTTDGADYQYTITYAIEKYQNVYEHTAEWIKNKFIPHINKRVEESGYLMAPFVGLIDGDPKNGIRDWVSSPRLSHGYTVLRNRPGLLIETHMLKAYKDRVYSTEALLRAVLELINEDHEKIRELNIQADEFALNHYGKHKEPYPFDIDISFAGEMFNFKGIEYKKERSWITGNEITKYTGEKFEIEIPFHNSGMVVKTITAPDYYIIPEEWHQLVDILRLHGINVERTAEDTNIIAERISFGNVEFADYPYEGRFRVNFDQTVLVDTVNVKRGSFIVNTEQSGIGIILYLLEPDSPDSFVKWGFFNAIFERKEYFEAYSMEPVAAEMAGKNFSLKEEFIEKIKSDSLFASSPYQRLNFFYERSPYFDDHYRIYPVLRVRD